MTVQVQPKMEMIPACPTQPLKATRIKRSRQVASQAKAPGPERDESSTDRRQLCEAMIQSGYVQSFVDFFYLTHRPDPIAMEQRLDEVADIPDIKVPPDEMIFLRDHLTRAESARRKGDTATVYSSFASLAKYFQHRSGDPKTGVYFYEKCLEIARLTGDFRGEMAANHDLGVAHSLIGDVAGAAQYHERHLEMARGLEDHVEVRSALKELIDVYRAAAEESEQAGDAENAACMHERCLESARSAGEAASEARAALALGKALVERGEEHAGAAIRTLETAEGLCRKLGDTHGEGRTCAALAAAWRVKGDDDRACDYLERYLELAESSRDLRAQAEACRTLGGLHCARGEYDRAVDLLKRNFAMARQLLAQGEANTALVDRARVDLGIAIGNASMGRYMRALNNDFAALLAWKISRDPLPADGDVDETGGTS